MVIGVQISLSSSMSILHVKARVFEVRNVNHCVNSGQGVVMTAWGVITRVDIVVQISIKYGHVVYKILGILCQECQIRGHFRSGIGNGRLCGHYYCGLRQVKKKTLNFFLDLQHTC